MFKENRMLNPIRKAVSFSSKGKIIPINQKSVNETCLILSHCLV